jgi:MoxR-like ATPase
MQSGRSQSARRLIRYPIRFWFGDANPLEQEGTIGYRKPPIGSAEVVCRLSGKIGGAPDSRSNGDIGTRSAREPGNRPKQIIAARDVVNTIYIDDRVKDYIVDVVWATREPASYNLRLEGLVRYGASPRATIYLALGARAHAFLNGRGYVTPQDVKSIGPDVLRHRIIVSYEAEAESVTSETIIERIFAGLPVP